jgi:hypothetical protein
MADKIFGLVRIASQVQVNGQDSVTLSTPMMGLPAGTVTIPMDGFPDGFKLKPGERVTLAQEPSGRFIVKPHVRPSLVTGRVAGGHVQSFVVFTTDEPGPPNVMHVRPI